MNAQQEKAQRMIVNNIEGITSAIKAAVAIKDAFRKTINDLTMHGTETYSPEYVEKAISKAKSDYATKMQTANIDMVKRLEELRGLYHDRDAVLDLGNPALTNALSLIQTIGGNLTFEEAVKINANFVHDQSSLRAIKAAYLAHSASLGNIDGMIYDANPTIDKLKELAYQGLVQDGSINYFAGKLSKLAALEGLTTETLPDEQGNIDTLRQAAGLPVQHKA